jgi:hypothetical protein
MFIAFVRRNKNGRILDELIFGILINLVGRNTRIFELKIASSNMKSVEYAIGVALWISFSRMVSDRCHQSGSGTLNFVNVSDMISNETFHPQIFFPIL